MSKTIENTEEALNLLARQNDVAPSLCTTAVVTDALGAVSERTIASEKTAVVSDDSTAAPLVDIPATTMVVDENDGVGSNRFSSGAGFSTRSSSSGCGDDITDGAKRRDKNSKRKTRRGKAKRGKRSSSTRPYRKTQWKFQVPHLWTAANKRRAEASLGPISTSILAKAAPFLLSDQPPLVPYNTNRFLMEDHMPHALTPSGRTRDSSFSIDSEENYFYSLPEDEEEFLTKEFSSVYEDARSERLEGLSKTQLIQEYLQLEANYEQITRRYNAVKSLSIKEENESAAATTKDASSEGEGERRRLEERIRELTTENLDLRRQLEHAARIGMVLSARSSPRPNDKPFERMDSSSCAASCSSEDSESDSSSSTSSSSSNDGSSTSSMSDEEVETEKEGGLTQNLVSGRTPIGVNTLPMEENGYLEQNGLPSNDDEAVVNYDEELNEAVSPLSAHSINSPPPPPLAIN